MLGAISALTPSVVAAGVGFEAVASGDNRLLGSCARTHHGESQPIGLGQQVCETLKN
jgi:hypothetical protein